ncbi:MAG: hypothetical protein SGJ02_11690 [bacterium]|nr:hypothetical protein [bacterium]
MKFVSKNLNLGVTLRNGVSANPVAGVLGRPGLYARFLDGLFESKDEDVIARMMGHAAYNVDFVCVEDTDSERFNRAQLNVMNEPEHDITNIEFGHVGKSLNPRPPLKITPEIEKILQGMAVKMAQDMLVKMAQDSKNKQEVETVTAEVEGVLPVKKMGRPAKEKLQEVKNEES